MSAPSGVPSPIATRPAADSFRFRPPTVEPPADLGWVLDRAFAEAEGPARPLSDPAEAAVLARALGLSARLARRTGRRRLTHELGEAPTESLCMDLHRATARAVVLLEQAELVGRLAASRGVQVVFVKAVGLIESAACRVGGRPFGDVDALVPARQVEALAGALIGEGFRSEPVEATEHHLPLLRHPHYGLLELHLSLPELRILTEPRATADEVLELGLCVPWKFEGTYLPVPGLLAAHAVVHGVAQHGLAPAAYPFLRCFGDLLDLAAHGNGELLPPDARRWIGSSLSRREIEAVVELARSLAAGVEPSTDDARALRDHALAGALDADYRRALKVESLRTTLQRRDWGKLGRRLRPRNRRVRYPSLLQETSQPQRRQATAARRLSALRELLLTPISWLRIRARRR